MILDTNRTTDLGLGIDRRIPQESDAQTIIPPLIQPVVRPFSPQIFNPGANDVMLDSFLKTQTQTFNNSAAANFAYLTIARGLWRLAFIINLQFDYTGAAGINDEFTIRLTNSVTSVVTQLWGRFAFIGSSVDVFEYEVLLRDQYTIQFSTPLTGVSENINFRITTNGQKIL